MTPDNLIAPGAANAPAPRRRVVIAGASGLIGRALASWLEQHDYEVIRLVRRAPVSAREVRWNPASGEIDAGSLEGVHAVVNLSGENIAGGRWTTRRREQILRSRVDATRTLVVAMRQLKTPPRVFLSASATGFYGDRGDEELTEDSGIGHGFLPELCLAWETHAEGAARQGIRTVILRFGLVLSREGGALAKLLPAFRLGVGGRQGSGKQWMSWIGIEDAVGAIYHLLEDSSCAGAVNILSPEPVTNADLAATLGRVLQRPAWFSAPAWGLRMIFGAMADEALLISQRVRPSRLLASGYTFQQPELQGALESILARR